MSDYMDDQDDRLERVETRLDILLAEMQAGFRYAGEIHAMRRWRAAQRVQRAFLAPVAGGLQPVPRSVWRFQPVPRGGLRPAPWGWRWLKQWDRNAALCLPLWLYWPVRLWLDRYRLLFGPLYELGFWSLREGDLYVSGRWTWAWWRTLAAQRREDARYGAVPITRWERFGWALRNAAWCFVHDRDEALT